MNYQPIPTGYKGRLRWDFRADIWRWINAGPYLQVVVLGNGNFRVSRVRL